MNSDLQSQLKGLHTQLQNLSALDGETRTLLITVLADITALLAKGRVPSAASAPSRDESVADRFEQLALSFEAEHPSLSLAMRQVVEILAKAGI